MGSPGGIKPERINCLSPIAYDRHVVRNTDEYSPLKPHRIVLAVAVDTVFDAAIDGNDARFVWAFNFPGGPISQPIVGLLPLVSIIHFLFEEAVLVINPNAISGHAHGRERIQEA